MRGRDQVKELLIGRITSQTCGQSWDLSTSPLTEILTVLLFFLRQTSDSHQHPLLDWTTPQWPPPVAGQGADSDGLTVSALLQHVIKKQTSVSLLRLIGSSLKLIYTKSYYQENTKTKKKTYKKLFEKQKKKDDDAVGPGWRGRTTVCLSRVEHSSKLGPKWCFIFQFLAILEWCHTWPKLFQNVFTKAQKQWRGGSGWGWSLNL